MYEMPSKVYIKECFINIKYNEIILKLLQSINNKNLFTELEHKIDYKMNFIEIIINRLSSKSEVNA